jgi:spectinomycin phosphotransferase
VQHLHESGLNFTVAPRQDLDGNLLRRLGDEWAVALFPYIDGEPAGPGPWDGLASAVQAASLVGRVHAASPPTALRPFRFHLPHRETLFDGIDRQWGGGPFGETARAQLSAARRILERLLAEFDRLAEVVSGGEPPVITHGEPHSANFIQARDASLKLIDWDTVRLAPRERDLWMLPLDRPEVLAAYQDAAGLPRPRPAALHLFRLAWDLTEVCLYIHRFQGPHGDTTDDQTRWRGFQESLENLSRLR